MSRLGSAFAGGTKGRPPNVEGLAHRGQPDGKSAGLAPPACSSDSDRLPGVCSVAFVPWRLASGGAALLTDRVVSRVRNSHWSVQTAACRNSGRTTHPEAPASAGNHSVSSDTGQSTAKSTAAPKGRRRSVVNRTSRRLGCGSAAMRYLGRNRRPGIVDFGPNGKPGVLPKIRR